MDVTAAIIKLKPNTLANVETWQNELQQRKAEAIETLKAEGVYVESWFHFKLEGQDYLLAYMRAADITHAQQVAKSSSFDIDRVHRQFKQNWERPILATLLLDLENVEH